MKKLFLISALLFLSGFVSAQDTITTNNNKVLVGKISEVTTTTIKYKKIDMPDGPDFILDRSSVKKIMYKNGTQETMEQTAPTTATTPVYPLAPSVPSGYKFVESGNGYTYNNMRVGQNRMYRIMDKTNDPELRSLTRKAKKATIMKYFGFAAIPAAAYAIIGLGVGSYEEEPFLIAEGVIGAVATVGFSVTGIVGNLRHKKMKAKAVALYNQKY